MLQFNDENINKFISDLTEKCNHYGIELYIGSKKRVNCGGVYTSGYFDGEDKKLAVAGGLDAVSFISILAHESCHLEQWILNNKAWKDYNKLSNEYDFMDIVKGLTPVDPYSYCKTMAKLEWDCEKRTIQMIKKYNLPIDINIYSQKANAYVYFWLLLPELKTWYSSSKSGKAPYGNKKILKQCSTKFEPNFNKISIPTKLVNTFKEIYKVN